MPELDHIAAGTLSWADLASPDMEASKKFYAQLFGWAADQVGGPEVGNYTMFTLRGKPVAGLAPIMGEGQPPAWQPYIASDSVDETATRVRAAGGAFAMEPMDVMDAGRMCIMRDPEGAFLGVWQAGNHKGAGIKDEAGSLNWVELQTRDAGAARNFYPQVFGWGVDAMPMGEGMPEYTIWKVGENMAGGAMPMDSSIPSQVPPHWLPYFQVANVDDSAARVKELGGQVFVGPMEFPGGHFAVVADTHGATFGIAG